VKEIHHDPICGYCDKPRSQHFHEDADYCYRPESHAQDVFTSEPSDRTLLAWLRDKNPQIVQQAVEDWKRENGHSP